MNRLAQESSPYLLQHADNPVDWYPWGAEAFAKARAEDKPILLSVGYSACHWCHVMAHESFEDEATAALMNAYFVNVKVDREERPDIDAIYMNALQAMTGAGGWPMTVVMDAEGKPFFAGTYFPPDERFGRPSFQRVLQGLMQAWRTRREEVAQTGAKLLEYLQQSPKGENQLPPAEALGQAITTLERNYDQQHAGFGSAPKFPPHSTLGLLRNRPEAAAQHMLHHTLQTMARGGIYDQLGGGFARYSVDALWLVPHFEKMLYDNAQLLRCYSEAYTLQPLPLYARVVRETVAWLEREMTSPEGGFYSALDADSEGEEGKFYLWQGADIDALLSPEDAKLAKSYFDISTMGNFEGRNILNLKHPPAAVAERFSISLETLEKRIANIQNTLFEARAKRVRPGLDDKILCSWNGLMLQGLASAARCFDNPDYLALAQRSARFIREAFYEQGRLQHSYKQGRATVTGMLEDYAYVGLGLLELYQLSLEPEHLTLALELAQSICQHFRDPEGGFFNTPDDGEALIIRPKDRFDAATPSAEASAAQLLLMLWRYNGNDTWRELAQQSLARIGSLMLQHPHGFASHLSALAWWHSSAPDVVLVGQRGSPDLQALQRTVQQVQQPHMLVAQCSGADDPLTQQLPLLQERSALNGQATAYVCQNFSCRLPVTTPEALREQLEANS